MPEGFITDIDSEILREVLTIASDDGKIGKTADGHLPDAFSSYLDQIVRFATGDDKNWSEPIVLLERAQNSWALSNQRAPKQSIVSLEVKSVGATDRRRLMLDVATDDKPFIVDSISALLADAGKPVSFFSNTVVDIYRDDNGTRLSDSLGSPVRESYIHAEMDPPVSDDELEYLRSEIQGVLNDVSAAVSDWEPMRARLASCFAKMERSRIPDVNNDEQKEAIALLKWLWDNRFVFLGVRSYRLERKGDDVEFVHDHGNDLGILRDSSRRVLKATFEGDGSLSEPVADFLNSSEPIIIAKANAVSRVHRRAYLDYVGVKVYGVDGKVVGEERFLGLLGSDSYNHPAAEIPLIKAKVNHVIEDTGFNPGGHNEKALVNILETYPRDELFQVDADHLRETSLGILRLYKRPRVKLFLRRDRFDRFVSALVFIPRDHFSSNVRRNIGTLLADTYHGEVASFTPFFGDASLVRVHFIIDIDKNAPEGPPLRDLTDEIIRICANWNDALRNAVMDSTKDGGSLFQRYENAFTEGYKERNNVDTALRDIGILEQLTENDTAVRAFRCGSDGKALVRLKIYRRDQFLPLSDIVPTIDALGLSLIQESSHEIEPDGQPSYWIHDLCTEHKDDRPIELDDVHQYAEDLVLAVLAGKTEDDGFNALVLTAGINWREAAFLRTCAKYHMQAGFSYSQAYMEETLSANPEIARNLISVLHARFNPEGPSDPEQRMGEVSAAEALVIDALETVPSLDEDRIIRRFLELFAATTRTNFFQHGEDGDAKPYISIKIDSAKIAELPEPRPYREIFVSGPRVDGIHLRFGPVARGGLRWSDRREDFRTEVLGLVKAQKVKNAVIVPTGSKGGFYPKQLPVTDDRNAIFEEGRAAYKLFIRGLLDVTDNIVSGKPVTPLNSVIWDDPDPYLVVAADKGTAQFSDTANKISEEYGFWLGDAFASGGSAGYDHKAMGITARGAWVAVKRHFREAGKDIQNEPFTVAGVGDMSGDVFGNGMLLSEQIRLVAAFDHRDIFIDPDPDPATSYAERKRLFELDRSSWNDYNPDKLSKGGVIVSRSLKSIPLSGNAAKALSLDEGKYTPSQIIKAILRMKVELFWLGGIGTYFKTADEETHTVGDRANDAVRINIDETRISVIGEGANLGLTQKARIQFAAAGGRVNTDAIDNSAGVDSSDHEVNIKILLTGAIEKAELKRAERETLLADMTDNVASHVLRHNYDQTRGLTLMQSRAARDLDLHARFISTLERHGRLDRAIEDLPDTDTIIERRAGGNGLYRPELSVLLAYAKMWLFDELMESSAPDDPEFESELFDYFPQQVAGFTKSILNHQLRREIIATRIANEIVDVCGINIIQHIVEGAGHDLSVVALAYQAARRIFGLNGFSSAVDALDNRVDASIQNDLYADATNLLQRQVYRLLGQPQMVNALTTSGIKPIVSKYKAAIDELRGAISDIVPAAHREAFDARKNTLAQDIGDESLALTAASLPYLEHSLDIVDLAAETGWSNPAAAAAYFSTSELLNIDSILARANAEPPADHYDRIAMRQSLDDFTIRQRAVAAAFIRFIGSEPASAPSAWVEKRTAQWVECFDGVFHAYNRALTELDIAGAISLGKLTLSAQKMDELIANTSR